MQNETKDTDYLVDPDEHRFPFMLVGLTYVLGSSITGYVFLSTGSFLWSTIAMFASGVLVPATLIFTPGLSRLFMHEVAPVTAGYDAELQAWQNDLAMEELEADLLRQRLEAAEARHKQVS